MRHVARAIKNSSLHNIVFNSFRLFFLLWSLLAQAQLSFREVIVVQKSYSGDRLSLKKGERKYFFFRITK